MKRLLIGLLLSVTLLSHTSFSQTNVPARFQGFLPGQEVRVHSLAPLVMLGRAVFESKTGSNIVVIANGERFVLNAATVTLSNPTPATEGSNSQPSLRASTLPQAIRPATGEQGSGSLMARIQQEVLGPFAGQAGFGEATRFFNDTMRAYNNGELGVADIARKAQQVLKDVDQYRKERNDNPQFEPQIEYLKSFVERAIAEDAATAP